MTSSSAAITRATARSVGPPHPAHTIGEPEDDDEDTPPRSKNTRSTSLTAALAPDSKKTRLPKTLRSPALSGLAGRTAPKNKEPLPRSNSTRNGILKEHSSKEGPRKSYLALIKNSKSIATLKIASPRHGALAGLLTKSPKSRKGEESGGYY